MKIFHADHIETAHVNFIKDMDSRGELPQGFIKIAVKLPDHIPFLDASLYGPSEGDAPVTEEEAEYIVRSGRKCASRVVNRGRRQGRFMVIIGMKTDDETTIYTAYGSVKGVIAEREPGDPFIATMEEITAAREFWAVHALVK